MAGRKNQKKLAPTKPPKYFKTPDGFRKWLEKHHCTEGELWVGYYKKDTGRASITWPESVEQALCFGWIDGIRRKYDETSYMVRFTPRRPKSNWSKLNVSIVERLKGQGLMTPAGLDAYEHRSDARTYSYEDREQPPGPWFEKEFRKHGKAWVFFQSRPAWYRKAAAHWVTSAKKEETRKRRMTVLIEDSEKARSIKPLRRPSGQKRKLGG